MWEGFVEPTYGRSISPVDEGHESSGTTIEDAETQQPLGTVTVDGYEGQVRDRMPACRASVGEAEVQRVIAV